MNRMHPSLLALGGLAQASLGSSASASVSIHDLIAPKVPCSSLTATAPEGATLINATGTERYDVTYEGPTFNGDTGSVNVCQVEVFLTHGDAGDEVRFTIYLPLDGWNGRFQGTGGGGFAAGAFDLELVPAAAKGYSAAATDAGVGLLGNTSEWYNSPQLIENFVHLSLHEMTVLGKDLSERYYGQPPSYSYWFGCSTGGRQGMSEAQRYPDDYDGIVAAAPAINWDRLIPADYWPLTAQLIKDGDDDADPVPVSACKLEAINNAGVAACDLLDGAIDGLISNPLVCDFDAASIVGQEVQCDDEDSVITERDAAVWTRIRDGFKDESGNLLWYGLPPGTNYTTLAVPPGFLIPQQWFSDFLLQSPGLDVSAIGHAELVQLFHQSVSEFGDLWSTSDADLLAFRARGGKILTWHGWADELISPLSTLEYWQRVVNLTTGGAETVDDFYRVFMAPGLGHCSGGPGPQIPTTTVETLVEWVEGGKAPETLFFSGNGQSRNICKYPLELQYSGSGNVSDASSWKCV